MLPLTDKEDDVAELDYSVPQSPNWWLKHLYKRIVQRRAEVDFFSDYYSGEHPLPWVAPQARDEFRRLVRMTRSNYMGLVCDAQVERITIEGFRFGSDTAADDDTWRIFQANNLDSDSDMAILEAAITGQSYLQVAPNPKDAKTPHIWVEHASQAIVAFVPGTNRRQRAASLKVWDDEWTDEIHATIQTPEFIAKYKAKRPKASGGSSIRWEEREVAGEQPNGQRLNPLKVVSMVEVPNNPRLLTGGISELYDLTDCQDRANKTLFDRLQTQEFGVDPQKWGTAFPDKDEEGNANVVEFGRNRMVTTDIAETKFGNFTVAPLDPYSMAKREDVRDIASRSRTPAQYLLGDMSNVNGETLKASESGLISKVKQRRRPIAEAFEEAMRIARTAANLTGGADARMETIFANPEFRTEGELADATVKKLGARIITLRQAREDLGYTDTQIKRMEDEDDEAARDPEFAAYLESLQRDPQVTPSADVNR